MSAFWIVRKSFSFLLSSKLHLYSQWVSLVSSSVSTFRRNVSRTECQSERQLRNVIPNDAGGGISCWFVGEACEISPIVEMTFVFTMSIACQFECFGFSSKCIENPLSVSVPSWKICVHLRNLREFFNYEFSIINFELSFSFRWVLCDYTCSYSL
jgi:hypothetical protein